MANLNLTDEEISSIRSIYEEDDIFSFDHVNRHGKFFAKYESSTQFKLNIVTEKCQLSVKHLPPIVLTFELPPDYPSKSPPNYTIQSHWLSSFNLERICLNLDQLWKQSGNSNILFTWISFLVNIFDFLKIDASKCIIIEEETVNKTEDKRFIKLSCSANLLRKYDSDQEEAFYFKSYHLCDVCFVEKLGSECFRFPKCHHTYCNQCMKTYFETMIVDGKVNSLTCPSDKCESQAQPAQILALVGLETFNRYDTLLLKHSINSMEDIVYCPRAQCQCPVIPDESLARCNACEYVFCALCRQGYHGIEPCRINNSQLKQICDAYKLGDEETRSKLIKQYGEKRIQRAIEESDSMELISITSKQCPNCKSWLQKLDGCNKMTCSKCQCYFCWLCLTKLSKADPYSHFNLRTSECFEKLFEGVLNENGEPNRMLEFNFDEDENEERGVDQENVDEQFALRLQLEEIDGI